MSDSDSFSGVHPRLRTALLRRGFSALTPVQEAVLAQGQGEHPDRDLRISSQTGSGKTVALGFMLAPSLAEASGAERGPGPVALVITPTRELAVQVCDELAWLYADVPGVEVGVVTGGTSVPQERRQLAQRPRLLVGTPGRLLDHLRTGALDCSQTEQVVLDEADQMLDMGFRDELNAIVEQLPEARRSHLVSATFPPQVRRLADAFQRDPIALEGTQLGTANADIEHVVHVVRRDERYAAIVNTLLMAQGERCLVFVRRRADAATVAERLSDDGFSALPLSGDLAQAQRTRTLSAFRNGTIRTLVATDVAARGIDVADISIVIHGDLPDDAEVYTHRSGRTGRAGRSGKSVMLAVVGAERRVHALLRTARVEAQWTPVPSPQKIRRALQKALRAELHGSLQDAAAGGAEGADSDEARAVAPAGRHVEYARALLEQYDPIEVVSVLLGRIEPKPVCEPMTLVPPPRREPPRHFDRREPRQHDPRDRRPAPRRGPPARGAAHAPKAGGQRRPQRRVAGGRHNP